jgi:hypothetical protein
MVNERKITTPTRCRPLKGEGKRQSIYATFPWDTILADDQYYFFWGGGQTRPYRARNLSERSDPGRPLAAITSRTSLSRSSGKLPARDR